MSMCGRCYHSATQGDGDAGCAAGFSDPDAAACIADLSDRIRGLEANAERESAAGVRLGIEMARKTLNALADEWGETALASLDAANDQAVGVPEWHAEVRAALSAAARRDELHYAAVAIGEMPTQGGAE